MKLWTTFNQPLEFCIYGYGLGSWPPRGNDSGVGEYLCAENILKAHASAYHLYQEYFAKLQEGKVGITLGSYFFYSDTNDSATVDRAMQFNLGWYAHPIFSSSGDYPEVMVKDIHNNSLAEGRSESRLPPLTEEWKKLIAKSADFIGLNYYTSRMAKLSLQPEGRSLSWERDSQIIESTKPEWKQSAMHWLYSVPEGLGDILR